MKNRFKGILTAPVFEDEIKTQQAYMLHMIVWTLIFIPIPFLLYVLASKDGNINRVLAQVLFGEVVNTAVLLLLRRGDVRLASIIQVSAFWLFFTVTSLTGGGVQGEAYLLGYGLVIAIAGILLGGSGALIFTILSLIAGGVMVFEKITGSSHSGFESSPLSTWIVSLILFPLGALIQNLASRTMRISLQREHASEERYRLISRVSSDYTFSSIFDANGQLQLNWVAGAFEAITGYTFEEYQDVGGWRGRLHPDDLEKDIQAMKLLQSNQKVISELRTIAKNGEIHWVRVYAHPVWNEERNRLDGIVGAAQDITEQKQIQETLTQERDLLQIFMDNIPDTIYFKDADSRFIRVNKAQAKFLKLDDPLDAIGKTDLDFQSPELARQFMDEEKEIVQSGIAVINRVEFNPAENGALRWISATKVPVKNKDGQVMGIMGISRDVTTQMIADEHQKHRRELLEEVIKLGKVVTESDDLRGTIKKIWHGVHDVLKFDRLAVFLYNSEMNAMEDTFGTDNTGQMEDNWHISFPILEGSTFAKLLETPDGYYLSENYDQEDNNIDEDHDMYGVKYFVAVSAFSGNKPVAVICADNLISQRPIPPDQLEALRLFAGYAGLAIENSRLHEAVQNELAQQKLAKEQEGNRRAILEKVIRLGQDVTEVHDLRTTLTRIWRGVRNELGFDRIGIYLYNAERSSMDGTFGTNNQGEMVDEWQNWVSLQKEDPESNSFLRVLEKPNAIYLTHTYEQDYRTPEKHVMSGVKDFAAIAAWAGENPVAVICVDQNISGLPITNEQLEGLRLFAGYAGLAIENARLNENLQSEISQQKLAKEQEEERRVVLEKVIKLGQYVTEVNDLRTTLSRIWEGARYNLGFDRLAIFIYNPARNSMDGTFGTNNLGEMTDEWHISHSMKEEDNPSSVPFIRALEKPDTVYLTHDFEREFNIPKNHVMSGVKDFATIAAWVGDKPVAFISVDQRITGHPIANKQLEALRLFAGYAGLAIENARLNESLQTEIAQQRLAKEREGERRLILEKVIKLGQSVTEVFDLRTTLHRIWHGVHDDLKFDRVGIYLYNAERNSMDGTFGTNNQGEMIDEWHTWYSMKEDNRDTNSFLHVFEKPDTVYLTNSFETEYNIPTEGHNMSGVKDHASIGAWGGGKPVAVLSVDNRITGIQFTQAQLEALRLFAGYVGLAIENARLNSVLESELALRKKFIVELEAKNAELERFTYTVSHDLKSPLVTIRGFLGYLERDAQKGDFTKFKQDTLRIETAVGKMQNLLKDLLDLSRIGRLINQPTDVFYNEIVKDALEIVHGQIEEKNIAIEYNESDVIIHCDKIRLTEALQNLLDNATKFMGSQPNPKIEISFLKNETGEIVFYVKDNGIGIAPEYHENIFGLFNKLETESNGTGVGLALVKRIIEVHGGRIWVESQVGKGTTFYFTLPQ